MRRILLTSAVAALFVIGNLLIACGDDADNGPVVTVDGDDEQTEVVTDGDQTAEEAVEEEAEVEAEAADTFIAYTTLQKVLFPTKSELGAECAGSGAKDLPYCQNPAISLENGCKDFFDYGMGQWEELTGEDFTLTKVPGLSAAELGVRRSLFRWGHLSDVHITDEESPNRMALFDTKVIPSALRPMDMLAERVLDDTVRTINYFNNLDPIDLVIVSGDVTDNAQRNEMTNFISILDGKDVQPDSGAEDDPVPGPDNDGQDPFTAIGLDVPWIASFGNHDELVLGNWPVDESNKQSGMSDDPGEGTRNGKTFEVTSDTIPADPDREPMTHVEMMELYQTVGADGQPAGHGLGTDENIAADKGYYAYDPPSQPLVRVIVLDSAYRPQGFEGQSFSYVSPVIDMAQFEDFLVPALDQSVVDKKFVIISMHHGSWLLQNDGFADRFVSQTDFIETIGNYPNVLALCMGHSHENDVHFHAGAGGVGGFVEIQASSLIDWPQQFRFYELVDNGNGTVSLFSVVMDRTVEPGSLSELSRRYSLLDVQTGWGEGGRGVSSVRNVEFRYQIPVGFEDAVSQASGLERVQSLTNWK